MTNLRKGAGLFYISEVVIPVFRTDKVFILVRKKLFSHVRYGKDKENICQVIREEGRNGVD